ncbi:MAG TPA: amino acid adenylation domain-containing protein, partial [Thermoanaerobaculia bacterium]|nr:amino acid adenylation domain-containing protein [Thermoanaerobaculia bacterium]
TDLFDRTTIDRLSGHFERLLAAFAEDPDRPVSRISLVSPAEAQQILREWNDTGSGEPDTGQMGLVHEVFAAWARRHPDRVAVVWEGGSWTYAELDRRAGQLAAHLWTLGVGPDVPVAVLAERGPLLAAALLGTLKAGGAYLPLDPAFPAERLRFMLEDSGAPVLLTQTAFGNPLGSSLQEIDLDSFDWSGPSLAPVPLAPDHISYVVYTSGSTGRPKGSALPHRALANLIGWQTGRLAAEGIDPSLRTLQFASPSFDVTFQETFATWCAGGTMIVCPDEARRDPRLLVEVLVREKVEQLYLPFVAFQQLAEQLAGATEDDPVPTRLREILVAGERLQITPQIAALFRRLPGSILRNQYGPSETHVVTEHTLRGDPGRWPHLPPIGRPVARTAVYLIDRAGLPVPVGVSGELLLGGANLARGYLGRPALTAEKFVPDPFSGETGGRLYRSGDLARYRADGEIEFLGRADHQLKIRGFRIEPGEIEVALAAHPQVREAVVVARGAGPADRRLVAYVVPAQGESSESLEALRSQDLRAFLRDRLPEYMIPAAFVPLAAFPLTGSGKVQRAALPEPEESRAVPYVPPATALEGTVAEVVAAQLGVRQVGRDDNFFEAGAHSLLLVRVAGELGRRLGRKVAVVDLFRFPTVASLAAFLGEGAAAEAPPDRAVFAARAEERARRRPHRTRREEMAHEPTPPPLPAPASVRPEPIESKPDSHADSIADSIAIVGLACRYPGANDPAELWRNLRDGVESIT